MRFSEGRVKTQRFAILRFGGFEQVACFQGAAEMAMHFGILGLEVEGLAEGTFGFNRLVLLQTGGAQVAVHGT